MHNSAVQALAMQNVAEFWNTATRPAASNGLGFSIEEERDELLRLESFFEVLHENAASYIAWKALVVQHRVIGVQVHDPRLVAVMQAHDIRQIVTFNASDLTR